MKWQPIKSVWDFLLKIFSDTKTWLRALATVFIVLLVVLALHYYGYDIQKSFPFIKSSAENTQSGVLASSLKKALDLKLDYLVESVTKIIHIEDSPISNPTVRHIQVRTVYVLRALRPITRESTKFSEEYTYNFAKEVQYWHGPEFERLLGGGKNNLQCDLIFESPAGESRTLVTGANVVYDLPLPDNRTDHDIQLRYNEDVEFYENLDDVIPEASIIIESASANIKGGKALRMNSGANRVIQEDDVRLYPKGDGASGETTISARWTEVSPGETLAVRYSW